MSQQRFINQIWPILLLLILETATFAQTTSSLSTFGTVTPAQEPLPGQVLQVENTLGGDDSSIEAQREACVSAGREWNAELNRCIFTQEAFETRENATNCASAENPEECFLTTAEESTGVEQGQGQDNKTQETTSLIGASVSAAYAAFLGVSTAAAKGKSGKSFCPSKLIFIGASAAWLGGDIFLKFSARKRFKELQERYQAEATNTELKGSESGSFQSQIRAFNYLREEQQIVESNAGRRFLLHLAAGGGFGASLALGLFEAIKAKNPTATGVCRGSSKAKKPDASAAADAKGAGASPLGLGSSGQIALASSVMLGINGFLAFHSKNEERKAKDAIEEIDKTIASFSEAIGGFCPDGRDDLNNARCYCFSDSGERNPNRTNSQICQDLFAADDRNFAVNPTDFSSTGEAVTGCLTIDGRFDESCRCRQITNTQTGQNACFTTATPTTISGNLGTALSLPSTVSGLNSLSNGASQGLATLNAADLQNQAARNSRLIGQLVKENEKAGNKIGGLANSEKVASQFIPKLATASAIKNAESSSLASLASSSRPSGGKLSSAIADAAKKAAAQAANQSTGKALNGGGGLKASGTKKKNEFRFAWNDDAKAKIENFKEEQAPVEDYDYKDNDIITREDASIWKVISRRYNTSGLRRLFGNE